MAKRTVCEEIVYRLANMSVKQIFGITGDALNHFTDAIRRDKRIQWFTVRHEETAAFAAAAQAELSGKLAVCAGTVGPGALHLINGLYNAKRDRSPVLAITGQVAREESGTGYFQEVDQEKVFSDACVFSETLRSPKQIPRLLQQAIEAALTEGGVAHLAIPVDITAEMVDTNEDEFEIFMANNNLIPTNEKLTEAANLINHNNKVAMLIGCGCRGASKEVDQLAKLLKAPVAHSLKGTEVLDYKNENSIGGVGHVGTPHGMKVLEKCDLLLMIGTDFPYRSFLPTHNNIIQIDINNAKLGHRCPIKLGLHGDVKNTINQLLPLLKEKKTTDFLSDLQKQRDQWMQKVDEQYSLNKAKAPMHPQSVILALNKLVDDDAIFVTEVGEVTVWVARHLRMRGKQRLIGSFNHGSLGVGLPAAIGAKALHPKRQVIALCGDGAFGMLLADFVTASRYNLPLVAIVFSNNKFGFVELEMEAAGMPRFATDLVNPDFAKIAQACGGIGVRIDDPATLEDNIKMALSAHKPVLLDVAVNPNELIVPSNIDPKTAWLFTQGKLKEMFVEKDIKVLFER